MNNTTFLYTTVFQIHTFMILIFFIVVNRGLIFAEIADPVLRKTLPASWDENWFSSPAVYDLDNNGSKEIIAGRHSVVYVWNSKGLLVWRAPVGENSSSANDHGTYRQYASPVVGDLDNDGFGEIAVAYSNKVAVYDHQGFLQTGWPQSFPGSSGEIRSIAAIDLDNNKTFEILAIKTSEGPVTVVWNSDGSVRSGWPQVSGTNCPNFGGYCQNIGAADLNGDSYAEIVATYDICHIGIFNGSGVPLSAHTQFNKAGTYSSNVPMFHDLALAQQGWGANGNDRDEFTNSPPSFADVDGDKKPEIILYSDHERAGEYKVLGNCLWVLNPDMTRVAGFEKPLCSDPPLFTEYENNIVHTTPVPVIGYLPQDKRPVILVTSYDGKLRCYSSAGTVVWEYIFDATGNPFIGASEPVIGDLNADGQPEIVFTTYSTMVDKSHLLILSASGVLLKKSVLNKRGCMAAPTLADCDGDGVCEILLSLKDVLGGGLGGVQIWDVATAKNALLQWPTGRGNYLRTGYVEQSTSAIKAIPEKNVIVSDQQVFSNIYSLYTLKGQCVYSTKIKTYTDFVNYINHRFSGTGVCFVSTVKQNAVTTTKIILP